jgi:hypothetical protein
MMSLTQTQSFISKQHPNSQQFLLQDYIPAVKTDIFLNQMKCAFMYGTGVDFVDQLELNFTPDYRLIESIQAWFSELGSFHIFDKPHYLIIPQLPEIEEQENDTNEIIKIIR